MHTKSSLFHALLTDHQHLRPGEKRTKIESFDILRGLSILFMILIHVMHNFGTHEFENSVPGLIIEALGGPFAAPVFMFVMGLFFVYTTSGSLRKGLKRGLLLILLGYALNLVRGIIPYYIYGSVLDSPWGTLSDYYQPEFLIFEVDILVFAGAAFILMALIYKAVKKPIVWLFIALAVSLLSPLVWGLGLDHPIAKYPLSILWGDYIITTFPVFPWLAFPLAGMAAGGLLCADAERRLLFNRLALYGLIPMAIGGILLAVDIDRQYHQYNQMGFGAITAIMGFILLWQWLIEKITNAINSKKKIGFFTFLSSNILVIYCVHWVIIKWLWPFIPLDQYGLGGVLLIATGVTIVAMLLTKLYISLDKPVLKIRK